MPAIPALNESPAPFDHHAFLAQAPLAPGVYDMRDAHGQTLYVGKAKHLKNRLASYFRATGLSKKTRALMAKVVAIELIITQTETEALLLEQNLIKDRKPPYNILLRDDKSYPYIVLTTDHPWPRLSFHRGRRKPKAAYFGPFPNTTAVRESLNLLQKVFKVRQCQDSYFRHRSRPCLQYQINRCKAPCVGLVSAAEYARDVADTRQFLAGKSKALMNTLIKRMERAATALAFEQAAAIRDQMHYLRSTQADQAVVSAQGHVDVIGFAEQAGQVSFNVMLIRAGQVVGHQCYFPAIPLASEPAQLLSACMARFYVQWAGQRHFPDEIIIPSEPEGMAALQAAIHQVAGKKIAIKTRVRGLRRQWLQLANNNAGHRLHNTLNETTRRHAQLAQLTKLLALPALPKRLECFDVSHTAGEATVAACVVFDQAGSVKSAYRRFNITGVAPGDDYGALRHALTRRYRHVADGEGVRPDLIVIDGGKGQLRIATETMATLGLPTLPLLGVAKGSTRKPGLETLIYQGRERLSTGYEAALLLIQQIRDEAHRFAITGHRQRRQKARQCSALEAIPGIGRKRRAALLQYFGGWHNVRTATVNALSQVDGISRQLAQQIYDHLHDD